MAAGGGHAVQGVVVVEEQVVFSFDALCRALGAGADEVQALVAEGLLEPAGHGPEDWRFGGAALARARTALRLARELDLGLAGAALVMDLLAEIEALRSRLRPG
ncbi:MAG: MerR family transcriptional regulator [Burkholderiales bacterium]|nr:MerR family transcriptional regulator [Burkholderiales bacterium]